MNEIQQKELNILIEFDRICKKHDLNYQLSSGTLLGAIRHNGFIPWDDDVDVHMKRSDYNRFLEIAKIELPDHLFLQTHDTEPEYFHGFAKIRDNSLLMTELSAKHLNINHGVWIDIFPYDKVPSDAILREEQRKMTYKYNRLISLLVFTFVTKEDKGIKRLIKKIIRFFNKHIIIKTNIANKIYMKREHWMNLYNIESYEEYSLLCYNLYPEALEDCLIYEHELENTIDHLFETQEFKVSAEYDKILTRLYGDYMELPKPEDRVSNHYYLENEDL